MSTKFQVTGDDASASAGSSSDNIRPRYTILPNEWLEFVHFVADERGEKPVYFYHQHLRILTAEDIYDAETLERVLDYANEHLEILAEEGSLERLPEDLELEIFGVGHPLSTGVAMYSYSQRKGFISKDDGEIETHPNETQFWQHVERFPVHRTKLPENADRDFRIAIHYGERALDFPYTNTQIQDVRHKYIELAALLEKEIFVLPELIYTNPPNQAFGNSGPLPLPVDDASADITKPPVCWQKYVNTVDGDALNKNKPRRRYYASGELKLVTDDDLRDPTILNAVLNIRKDHLDYGMAKGLHHQVAEDWETEIFGVTHFDGPRVAMYSYSQCTLYDARTVAAMGAVRAFWDIIEKYPMHRRYVPPKMEHLLLRALIEDSSLGLTKSQQIAARYWQLKVSHANGQEGVVPHLVWLIGKSMREIQSGPLPDMPQSSESISSCTSMNPRPRLEKLPSSWKEYVNLDNWHYFHNPILRLLTIANIYDPEIYEITLKTREKHFQTLEEDGLMGKLPQDWEIIILGQHHENGPYVAMCSYDECLHFLCKQVSPNQEAYWSLLLNFNMHREHIPEQLETIFFSALAESSNDALLPFTAQECQTLSQTYWQLKAQRSFPALVLHVCQAMAKIEHSRELYNKLEHCNLE